VFITDRESGRFIDVNESFLRLSHHERADVIGRTATELGLWTNPHDQTRLTSVLGAQRSARDLEFEVLTKFGESRSVLVSVEVIEIDGHPSLLTVARDITEQKLAQERLTYLANYDNLTGLPNRTLFQDRLTQALARADRHKSMVALLFFDLDRFKTINDSLGHAFGDQLLQQVANRVKHALRSYDTVARNSPELFQTVTISRLGGDEFTIVLEDIEDVDGAAVVARRVLDSLTQPFLVEGNELYTSASIGIAVYPLDNADAAQLIKHADAAMYRAKEMGRSNYQFYTADLNSRAQQRMSMEAGLRKATERDEFLLHYQPKVDVRTGAVTGVEALVRWNHPERGLIPPLEFIPLLEETGLIIPVGEWVLRTACAQVGAWRRNGAPPLGVAVNLSPRQFRQDNLIAVVADVLAHTGLPARHLELEVTESLLMDNTEMSVNTLAGLRAMGVKVAVDDFGTGYSSLNYLRRFAIDTLKIDRSFVREITTNEDDAAISGAIIALAHSLRLNVVAEGVENELQLDYLRRLNCDQAQGYLLSRPLPADAALAWILERHSQVETA
jgi:diguanylate cyclase (GGDEF)-like protein/PAS domain S-box-containing protein